MNGLYDLVAPRVKKAVEAREDTADTATTADTGDAAPGEARSAEREASGPSGPALDDYLGAYSGRPWGGETAVVRWEEGLAMLSLPTSNPARGLRKLRHVEGDTFRRVRDDGELAEAVIFLRDDGGDVTGYQQHRNVSPKIR